MYATFSKRIKLTKLGLWAIVLTVLDRRVTGLCQLCDNDYNFWGSFEYSTTFSRVFILRICLESFATQLVLSRCWWLGRKKQSHFFSFLSSLLSSHCLLLFGSPLITDDTEGYLVGPLLGSCILTKELFGWSNVWSISMAAISSIELWVSEACPSSLSLWQACSSSASGSAFIPSATRFVVGQDNSLTCASRWLYFS